MFGISKKQKRKSSQKNKRETINDNGTDNILKINTEKGTVEIEVLDVIVNETLNREYMVYRFRNQKNVYVSIVNQTETTFSLDTIEDQEEMNYIEEYLESKF